MIRLETAKPEDRSMLMTLLIENGMEYVEPIEDFVLAREGKEIVGCGRMEEYPDMVLIRPVVVAEAYRGRGIGRLLLEKIIPIERLAIVVARGGAVEFYKTFGFTFADWKIIPIHQKEECLSCAERAECAPQPMLYRDGMSRGKVL